VALAAGTLALTASAPVLAQDESTAPTGTVITKMGIIAPDVRTNLGWDQQGVDGAQAAADSVGAELIVADGVGYVDYEPIMRQLADDGAQFIITQASGYATTAAQFAADTGIPVIVFDDPTATTPGLVADVLTNAQEGAYLAGVLAATMSETGTLGMVISADTPSWHKANGGFVAGAKATKPDIKFVPVAQIGPDAYGDAEGGRRTTEAVIAAGADIVFGQGDGASFGMLQAVETATPPEGADKVWFIDVIGDKTSIDKEGVLLSSVLWDFSGAYTQAVKDIEAGTFGDAGYVQDVSNGGISLLQTDHISPEAAAAVEAARAGIADGSITVPTTNTQAEVDALIAGS
jgi:simple sugar transport system substrate-binding protein